MKFGSLLKLVQFEVVICAQTCFPQTQKPYLTLFSASVPADAYGLGHFTFEHWPPTRVKKTSP